jgi:hypothetical protein
VITGLRELAISQAAHEREEQGGEHEIEKHDPRIVVLVRLHQIAGALGEVRLRRGHDELG